jgi:uncharacterized protein YtpQ (UPF0354 family)
MKKKQSKIGSLKKARAALDKRRSGNSTDESPIYLTYHHPDNWFFIDYPAHWKVEKESDGAVQFSVSGSAGWAGIMLFRAPLPIDTEVIAKSGMLEQFAVAMFAKVQSTNVRTDPTIIYSNYKADRPEEDQAGHRWFVLSADLFLGISTSCSVDQKETYSPLFERMLSSLRIYRDDELLATRVMSRVRSALVAAMPDAKIQENGLTITTEKFEISIGNILAQVKRNPQQFNEIVDQFIHGTIGLSQSDEALGQESWENVRDRIQPLLKSDKYIQDANERTTRKNKSYGSPFLISAPWLADLRICYALDNKDSFRFINSYDMERWGVSLETLSQIAIDNLQSLPPPKLIVMRLSDELPGVGSLQPVAGASSSYLLHPRLFELASNELGRDIVAAIPARDALMLFEYRGERESLLEAVAHDFATTNHPISDRLFRVTPDGIALL